MDETLIILGPTAVGKTAVSLLLAERIGGEIISADAFQVYRGLDIATAKPSPRDLSRVPHHLIDILDPSEQYSAARFRDLALPLIAGIKSRQAIPIVVGGAGLYLKVLVDGIFESPPADYSYREYLRREEEEKGPEYLHRILQELDPAAAARIHPHNRKRIIRALEVYEATGIPISQWQTQWRGEHSAEGIAHNVPDGGRLPSPSPGRLRSPSCGVHPLPPKGERGAGRDEGRAPGDERSTSNIQRSTFNEEGQNVAHGEQEAGGQDERSTFNAQRSTFNGVGQIAERGEQEAGGRDERSTLNAQRSTFNEVGQNALLSGEKPTTVHCPLSTAYLMIGLRRDRADLYARIERRAEEMFEGGLIEETKRLLALDVGENPVARQALGYKETIGYLHGEYPREEAVRRLAANTRHFAKRQLTWWRRDGRIQWIDIGADDTPEDVVDRIIWYSFS